MLILLSRNSLMFSLSFSHVFDNRKKQRLKKMNWRFDFYPQNSSSSFFFISSFGHNLSQQPKHPHTLKSILKEWISTFKCFHKLNIISPHNYSFFCFEQNQLLFRFESRNKSRKNTIFTFSLEKEKETIIWPPKDNKKIPEEFSKETKIIYWEFVIP